MNDEQQEAMIVEKGLTAPRISLDHVSGMMDKVWFSYHLVPNTTTTVCTAILEGGFTLACEFAACVSPENFNEQVGRSIAHAKAWDVAKDKLYELEGYRLKTEQMEQELYK